MLNSTLKHSYLFCMLLFIVGIECSIAELVYFATSDVVSVSGIIMDCVNIIIFAGIIWACVKRDSSLLKVLVVSLIAWDGFAYLVNVLPNSFESFETAGNMIFNTVGHIATIISMILVVVASIIYLLGLVFNKDLKHITMYLYFAAAAVIVVTIVFATIFAAIEVPSMWGVAVEALLKFCIFMGVAMGLYILDLEEHDGKFVHFHHHHTK